MEVYKGSDAKIIQTGRVVMKSLLTRSRLWAGMLVFTALIFTTGDKAHATWMWIHGHSANLEYMDNVVDPEHYRLGWGLDFSLKPGTFNWVHFAVPTIGEPTYGARYIRLKFYTGSRDARVDLIQVYNADVLAKTFRGVWQDGWHTIVLDMGRVRGFSRGMGISIRITAGTDDTQSHRFLFNGAGARFVRKQ